MLSARSLPLPPLQASALASLRSQGFEEVARGVALLGFVSTNTTAGILLATRVTTKATLPGGHQVILVAEASWELLSLDAGSHPFVATADVEFWRSLQQHTISGTHFFCETADLTRPFPSSHRPTDPDPEFVWNAWLARPLHALGLPAHCPALLQGAVESADEVHPTGQRYTLAVISRRSRRHPGTRYRARGLNELAGPGNEIEAELVMWTPSAGGARAGDGVQWARVAWRRGTVPIWWGVELQPLNKGLQAEVYVRDAGTYAGMLSYFRGLQRWAETEAGGSGKDRGVVTCINLLHCNPKKAAELMLGSHFQEGMQRVRQKMAEGEVSSKTEGTVGESNPKLMNFDWHGTMAGLSEERGVQAFWHWVEKPVRQAGLAVGSMEPARQEGDSEGGSRASSSDGGAEGGSESGHDLTRWGRGWQMRWRRRQLGLLRFNCADSLDRTNAASCFAMLPVLQEGLRLLGIPLDVTSAPATAVLRSPTRPGKGGGSSSESLNGGVDPAGTVTLLPPGWEKKEHGGRTLYVDHMNRRTQWDPPEGTASFDLGPEWAFFSYSLEDVRLRLYADALSNYVSMFRKHGDVHSALYTGSPAMHSHVLGLVLATDTRPYAASASVGRLQNLRVAVQRRWNNTVSDNARQQAMEVFLGINLDRYCPGLQISMEHPLNDLSGPDSDDVEDDDDDEVQAAHQAAALSSLHLKHHDGRLGLEEDIADLEPLPSDDLSAGGASGGSGREAEGRSGGAGVRGASVTGRSEEDSEDEEGTVALDPLGAVRTPVRGTSRGSGGNDHTANHSDLGAELAGLFL